MKQYEVLKLEAETSKASFELDEFLYRELLDLNLKEGMQEDLEQRHDSLSHVKYLQSNFTEGIQIMENESVGVIDQLLKLKSLASGLATKSTQFSSLEERFNTLFIEAQDLLEECKNQYEALETNPEELEKLESRLDELNTKMLKHKVGSVTELLDVQHQLEVRLKKTSNLETELTELKLRAGEYEKSLHQLGAQLTHRRKQAIEILEKELCDLVSKMGMNEAVFRIDLETQKTFKSNGLDQLNFLFKSNKSSDFKPLKKIASGGELSRIMLSVKAILSNYIKLPTLIFDEIDTGVSGKISDSIAEVMVSMSEKLQVINITHLPQVAAKSHYHFKVKKHQEDQKTVTQLVPLDKASRIEEIALMLSGNKVSATAIAHAKQLMN